MAAQELNKKFHWGTIMAFLTAFQILTSTLTIVKGEEINFKLFAVFSAFIAAEWLYMIIASTFCNQNNFELETLGFLFSGIGLVNCASLYDGYAIKQAICILIGLVVFIVMLCVLRRTDIVMLLRTPVAVAAFGLLAANLVLAKYNNGALNWITIKGISIQPSEFVKLAFIFVGAASLDKLQSTRSLTKYLIFSFICIGALFLMRDFGTALIFFFTFIIIAFMRSGDVRTIALVCVAAALGAIMIIYFRPTVAARFETYRHIWDSVNGKGMQQTRTLIYSASGGLFGLGIGNGKMGSVVYSTTDLVFGMICEEWGMIVAFTILLAYVFILLYAIRAARTTRSAFYAIAACSAAGLLLFQAGLNVFGVTDILPFTGVTLPFISRGGSSIICSWGLLAFIKSADIRTYPKLSKTILPDHPLYPADVKIGKRTTRPRTFTPPNVNNITGGTPARKAPAAPKRTTPAAQKPPVRKAPASTAKKDIPISKPTSAAQKKPTVTVKKPTGTTASKRGGDRR